MRILGSSVDKRSALFAVSYAALITFSLCGGASLAHSLDDGVTLIERLAHSGDVSQVLVVSMVDSDAPVSVPATWIAPQSGEQHACIASIGVPRGFKRLQSLAVMLSSNGDIRSGYRDFAAEELPPTARLTLDDLRSRFTERRSVLRKLQSEVEKQELRLGELQNDADNIAMVSKIVSTEDELVDLRAKLHRLDLAEQSIDRRSAQMKSRERPLNAEAREGELVRQLSALSTALSAVENQALKRLTGAKGELQQKLVLIEDTKDDKITLLEEELAELKQRRRR
jgi:hypothetical protein